MGCFDALIQLWAISILFIIFVISPINYIEEKLHLKRFPDRKTEIKYNTNTFDLISLLVLLIILAPVFVIIWCVFHEIPEIRLWIKNAVSQNIEDYWK